MTSDISSDKRSAREIVALMMAIAGAMFFFVFLAEDIPNWNEMQWSELPIGLILRYVAAMAFGGSLAGLLFAGLFGRSGFLGWVLAAVGGLVATLFAGMLGSAVGLLPDLLSDGWQTSDIIPIVFGLLIVPLAIISQPLVAVVWGALIALTHVLAGRKRR